MTKEKASPQQLLWKILVNLWAILTLAFFWLDFLSNNAYNLSAGAMGVIYIGILTIYAGTKEFDRWKSGRKSYFKGEAFVLIWTITLIIMVTVAIFSKTQLRVPDETATLYIAIVTIFAISQKSKSLFHSKTNKK